MKKTSAKKQGDEAVDPRFAPVVDAFVKDRAVTYGNVFASMGLKVNGKIFAMMSQGRFVLKLPRDRVDELVRGGQGKPFQPGRGSGRGRVMKEWIVVNAPPGAWADLAKEAHRFVKAASA